MYSSETELFEIELIIRMKIDLALNNQHGLVCHKTQPTNQLNFWAWQNVYMFTINVL